MKKIEPLFRVIKYILKDKVFCFPVDLRDLVEYKEGNLESMNLESMNGIVSFLFRKAGCYIFLAISRIKEKWNIEIRIERGYELLLDIFIPLEDKEGQKILKEYKKLKNN